MKLRDKIVDSTAPEEVSNVLTHAVGVILFCVGGVFLSIKAHLLHDWTAVFAAYIFTASLIIQYLSSTLYHLFTDPRLKGPMHLADHIAIFILIAGTYTPILLVALKDHVHYSFTILMWAIAAAGIIYKLFFFGKNKWISLTIYLAMGWMAIFIADDFYKNLPVQASWWILAGGLSYSIGTYFYSKDKMKFHHAIWHLFVLAGSACHFIAIYLYVY